MPQTYAELFAGAGGLSRGLEAAGFACAAHAEIEPHARAVLRQHWPGVRLDGDVTKVSGADYRGITLLSGGSPCQDLSVAGKRKGLAGARSGLFHEQVRIWTESDAPYFLWENVLGALSSNAGKDFAVVLSTLVGAPIAVPRDGWSRGGVASGPSAVAAWRVLDLQHFGPPQRRVRVFVLAARAGGVDPAEVLALGEGLCRHPSPREQQRQRTARGIGTGAPRSSGLTIGIDGEKNANVELLGTLNTGSRSGSGQQPAVVAFHHTQTPISGDVAPAIGRTTDGMGVVCTTGDVTHALTHEGADASEDGTGRGTPITVQELFTKQQYGASTESTDVSSTIGARDHAATNVDIAVVGTLDVHDSTKWGSHQWVAQDKAMISAGRPRRLTPLECERLMSWPDHWTATGIKEDGTEYALNDTARYRLCGNGVGSVQVQWIADRLMAALRAVGDAP